MANNIMQCDTTFRDPYTEALLKAQQEAEAAEYQRRMGMLGMLPKVSDEQMAGYALGKLLKNGWNSWKDNYEKRGEQKQGDKNNPENWTAEDMAQVTGMQKGFPRLEPLPDGATPAIIAANRQTGSPMMGLAGFPASRTDAGSVAVAQPEQGLLGDYFGLGDYGDNLENIITDDEAVKRLYGYM